ncbi:hypothetical protein K933_17332 [Candidatus Halobonum tyrrellensis G22]|uniref:Uncharacterized protein n=1 Tax=Candidatus Halobonum tyrrellensis G22 TaxID=1324957 RepID=V4HA01_9EURY|nr:hypothetical protein K933_17332 [Candidatus Halobonum tyrrellensis G22]
MAFLHRVPFVIDALNMGFLPGFREDSSYQQQQFTDLKCPVGMLDNDFRNPDLSRYVERVFEHEPHAGIVGDAYDAAEARRYVDAIRELEASFPDSEFIVVPKCREAIDAVPDDIVLGYSRGYADTLACDFSDPVDWRGRCVHILGGSPPKQLDVIDQLTRPTLTGDPPAEIVGLDWNGVHRGAQFGEFWTADGWDDSGRDADHVSVRDTVRYGLGHVRSFWQAHGVWPETTPQADGVTVTYSGPSPSDLESAACTECETNVWTTERGPYVAEYDTGAVCGYCCYDCYFTHRQQNGLEEVAGERSVSFPSA